MIKDKGGHKVQVFIGYASKKFDIYNIDLIKYKVNLYANKKLLEIIPTSIWELTIHYETLNLRSNSMSFNFILQLWGRCHHHLKKARLNEFNLTKATEKFSIKSELACEPGWFLLHVLPMFLTTVVVSEGCWKEWWAFGRMEPERLLWMGKRIALGTTLAGDHKSVLAHVCTNGLFLAAVSSLSEWLYKGELEWKFFSYRLDGWEY